MGDSEQAQAALLTLNGIEHHERNIVVEAKRAKSHGQPHDQAVE